MSLVLGYFHSNSGVNMVCKYWLNLMRINKSKGLKSGSEIVYRDKVSRSEIRSLLNQLHFSKTTFTSVINNNTDELSNVPLLKNDSNGLTIKSNNSTEVTNDKIIKQDGDIVLSDDSDDMDSDIDLHFSKLELSGGLQKEFLSVVKDNNNDIKTTIPPKSSNQHSTAVTTVSHPLPPPPAYNSDFHLFGGKTSSHGVVTVSYDNILNGSRNNESFYTEKLAQMISPDKNINPIKLNNHNNNNNNNNYNNSNLENGTKDNNYQNGEQNIRVKPVSASLNKKPEYISGKSEIPKSNKKISQERLKTITEYISESQRKESSHSRQALKDALNSPSLEPPIIAESKTTRRPNSKAENGNNRSRSRSKSRSKSAHRRNNNNYDIENDRDDHMLQHVKKIRSEQQMNALVEFIQAGFVKIEHLDAEKRRVKKLIKAWNKSYEKNTGSIFYVGPTYVGHLF